jgi:uncharacterized protein
MPVILDLRELERFPAHVTITADPERFSLDYDGVIGVKAVTVDLTVQHVGEEYYCQGTAKATLALECARCLVSFETPVTSDMDFLCRGDEATEASDGQVVDDEDYAYFMGNDLRADITLLVQQALVLAIDIKPVCRDDCRGLCDGCGINLNEAECDCTQEKTDPRWDALRDLKKKS